MTEVITPQTQQIPAQSIGHPVLLQGLDRYAVLDHATHLALHGPLPQCSRTDLAAACAAVDLCGRGGGGFPVATKIASLGRARPVVVVNGSESEPLSRKDRLLLTRAPHLVLDGAAVVADALRARQVWLVVHDRTAYQRVQAAIAQRRERHDVRVVHVDGGFVAGEARAVVRALDHGPAVPPGRRTPPSERGVGGVPTFLSNAETFAQLAVLARLGPSGYARLGAADEPGTTLLTVAGAVSRPGVYEIDHATALGEVLARAGAAHPAGVLLGGYHGTWVTPDPALRLSPRLLKQAGATLGAGVVAVLDHTTCALGEVASIARWLAEQSAGQCGPCRFGLPAVAADLALALRGDAGGADRAHRHAQLVTGRGACSHPDGAARFVSSALAAFAAETAAHRHGSGCGRPVRGQLGATRNEAR